MTNFATESLEKFTNFWSDRTVSQQILIGGLAASVVIAFLLMVFWLNQTEYKVLYTKLYAEDASRVVGILQSTKEPYKIEDNGATIMVPADRVYDLRLKIAGEGAMHGQGIGYEIFDAVQIGQTDFIQRINYQRALQGELARTISEFPQVERARVHLVMPAKSLFIEEQAEPSASVVLKLKEGEKLTEKQVKGVLNLVVMSVEGLKGQHVTITDMRGQVLYQPEEDGGLGLNVSSSQLQYKAEMESKIEQRIQRLLMPIVGTEKVIAKVNAELDFRQRTIKTEAYDPDGQVARSEQSSEETTQGSANVDGGVPEANFRGDGFTGTATTQESTRETKTTNYEINKEEQQIIVPVGELKRLSVAVVVDGTYTKNAETGETTYVPRSAEEMERITELVRSAIGYDSTRGDSLEVSNMTFGMQDIFGDEGLMRTMLEYAQRLGKPFLNGLLIFLFLILVVRPVVMALIKPRISEEEIDEMAGLPEGAERLSLDDSDLDEEALDAARKLENAKAQALQLSEKNMDQAVQVLKTWLKQEAA
ncbi:flagellar basal-body MS-ring/collar protein FliF [Maridesulfovibrio frigidus]|uniref:flagellar basal-body MS-ring/collar protein FliF n=1 Tax=Maridesulfovibrio frigidus TaxID=340956 RepID=UPI0004E0BE7E|nr:flagellar basal-body MS-ring/collar protein FliF [Maridesulfovibrio frigidus]